MSVYKYVAQSNPHGAVAIINSFGYDVTDNRDLGQSLTELVANEGEPALKKVMENHPDKDIILEMFSNGATEKKDCNCSKCKEKHNNEYFSNATGKETVKSSAPNESNSLAHQTNVILVVSALFIATALIIKTK